MGGIQEAETVVNPESDLSGRNPGTFAVLLVVAAALHFASNVVPDFRGSYYAPTPIFTHSLHLLGMDLHASWVAAQAVRRGLDPYVNNEAYGPDLRDCVPVRDCFPVGTFFPPDASRFVYGPLLAFVQLPLAWLRFPWAFRLWLGVQLALLAASLWLLSDFFPRRRTEFLAAMAAISVISYPLLFALERGQSDTVVFFLCVVGLRGLVRRKPGWLSSLPLVAAALMKVYP